MSANLNWLSGSPEAVVEKLACAALEGRRTRELVKQAIDLGQIGTTIQNYGADLVNKAKPYLGSVTGAGQSIADRFRGLAPEVQAGLMGAGGGAALGGLSSLGRDPEERQTGSSMLTGALAGGALGYGGSLAWNRGKQVLSPAEVPPVAPPTIEHDGQVLTAKPETIGQLPEIHKQLENLKPGYVDQGIQTAWDTTKSHPGAVGGAAIGAAANTARPLSIAQRDALVNSLAKVPGGAGLANRITGRAGNVDSLRASISAALKDSKNISGLDKSVLEQLSTGTDESLRDVLNKSRAGGYGPYHNEAYQRLRSLKPALPKGAAPPKLPGFTGKAVRGAAGGAMIGGLGDYLYDLAMGQTAGQQRNAIVKKYFSPAAGTPQPPSQPLAVPTPAW